MYRAALIGGHGEAGLVDHSLQRPLTNIHGKLVIHLRKLRVIVGRQADDLEAGVTAGKMNRQLVVSVEHNNVVGHLADHLAEQTGAEDDTAGRLDLSVHAGADAGLHVVAGQGQGVPALQQDPLQGRNGAFGGHRPGGSVDGALQQRLLTGKSKHIEAFLSFRLKRDSVLQKRTKDIFILVTDVVGKIYVEISQKHWDHRNFCPHPFGDNIRGFSTGKERSKYSTGCPGGIHRDMWKRDHFLLLMLVVISLTFSA